jgi:hypothetical protein
MVTINIPTTVAMRPEKAVRSADFLLVAPPQAWPRGRHIGPMSTQNRTVRFAVNQASPPREVALR